MPLPKIATPTYELELPSNGETIHYRPFLVKEEKLLLLALESEETKQITTAIKTVIKSCISEKTVKVEALPTFDIEYLFLNIRGKSVGEEVDLNIICPDDGKTQVPITVAIDDIKVVRDDDHTNEVRIDDSLIMELKYPSLEEFIKSNFDVNMKSTKDTMQHSFDLIAACVDKIYNENEVWEGKDLTKKEILEFLEQMNSTQFKNVEKFFETMPKLKHDIKVTNPKTGVESDVVLEGLASFFA